MPVVVAVDFSMEKHSGRWRGILNKFHEIVRNSLRAAGRYWVDHYLELHFKTIAFPRYGYTQRTPRWRAKKDAMGWGDLPFVAREGSKGGGLRAYVLGNAEDMKANMVAVSRGEVYEARIKIRVDAPRPAGERFGINPRHAGELSRINKQEYATLHKIARAEFYRQINDFRGSSSAA